MHTQPKTLTKETIAILKKDNENDLKGLENIDFGILVRENSKKIFNVVHHMLGNIEESEEVVQEIFLEAYKSLPSFKGKSKLSTWLYRIAMNVLNDYVKKKIHSIKKLDELCFDDLEKIGAFGRKCENVESEYLNKLQLQNIKAAVSKLPTRYRAVFVLNVIEGYSHKEIADILKISSGAARIIRVRAAKILRRELQKLDAESGGA